MSDRPRIITANQDDDNEFRWYSDGWHMLDQWGEPESEKLLAKAKKCIAAAENVLDAIARLEAAGFEVVRQQIS